MIIVTVIRDVRIKDMIRFARLVIEISLETARLKFRDGMSQKIRGFVSKTVSRPKLAHWK